MLFFSFPPNKVSPKIILYHLQDRDLTVCPTSGPAISLSCTVLVDASGTGTGTFKPVGSVSSSSGMLVLDSYDPNGCYNILCETSDTIQSKRIEFSGSFVNSKKSGLWTATSPPFYISGAASGKGCTKLAPTCDALDITAKSTRAAPKGANLNLYSCASVKIACEEPPSCFVCPSGKVPIVDCPAGEHECKPECDDKDDSSDDGKSDLFKKFWFSKFGDKSKSKSCGDEDSSDSKDWFKKDGLFEKKDGLFKKFGYKDDSSESKDGDYKKTGYGYKDGWW